MFKFALLLIALLAGASAGKLPLSELRASRLSNDNSILPSRQHQTFYDGDFVKISSPPGNVVAKTLGSTIELECSAIGSPYPSIQWLRGNTPITDIDEFESNSINEVANSGVARVESRLIIDHVASAESTTYTCLARSGSKTALASSTVYNAAGSILKHQNLTELLSLNNNILNGALRPRVVYSYSLVMENIGHNILLPCQAVGRPMPDLYWLDINDNLINNRDPRFKVLPTGELLISGLRWIDMGGYTCVARNPLGRDTITAFVYPVLNED